MRTLRLLLVGLVIPGLLAGLTSTAAAQDEEPAMNAAYFTLTRGPASESSFALPEDHDGDGMPELRGQVESGIAVDATDPRASGVWTIVVNADFTEIDGRVVGTDTTSHLLVNDDGVWTGTGRSISSFGEDEEAVAGLTILAGEGAYEGLSLILSQSFSEGVESFWGVIIPSEKVPPMPGPVELTAE